MMSVSGVSYGKKPLSIQPEESNGEKNAERSMNLIYKTKQRKRETAQKQISGRQGEEVLPHSHCLDRS